MSLTIISAPAIKPLTLPEAKKHLRLAEDQSEDDWLVEAMIAAATDQAEAQTRRSLINRTYRLRVYAARSVELPKPPFVSVSSVKLINKDGIETTLTTDDYGIDLVPLLPVVEIKDLNDARFVVIEYVAGYGDTAGSVPESIVHWMRCQINTMYEFREAFVAGTFE